MTWTVALQVNDQRAELDAGGSFDHTMTLVGGIIIALAQLPCGGKITLAVETDAAEGKQP
jgi:hypothetical protein